MEKRVAWTTENKVRTGHKMVFVDEASFSAWALVKRAWSVSGERFILRYVKHPHGKEIRFALTLDGRVGHSALSQARQPSWIYSYLGLGCIHTPV